MKLKQTIKFILLLILLVSMGFLYGFSNNRNAQKIINEIDVQLDINKSFFLTESMVNKLLIQNNEGVEKQTKSVIDLYKLEEQVLKHPYIEKASLFMTIDGKLIASIKQRQPIARIMTNNTSYYIDLELVKVPLSQNYSARVPLITGVQDDEDLQKVIELLIKITDDVFLQKEIIGIHLKPNKEYIMSVRSGNYKIEFGKLTDIDGKIKKLKAFYNKVFLDSTIYKYKTINIKYHNQVVGVK
ncbi:MAG: Uncharacterised protein [Flavobacterium sp. SCGC AAA160-P02]|nr:MAG: Uncharacterised protein [Flavobacterium sp. SCGC AAA160-P02]